MMVMIYRINLATINHQQKHVAGLYFRCTCKNRSMHNQFFARLYLPVTQRHVFYAVLLQLKQFLMVRGGIFIVFRKVN